MTQQQRPTIGRIVHYVLAGGQHRAATVVNVPPPGSKPESTANLTVHLDQMQDMKGGLYREELAPENAAYITTGGTLAVSHAVQDEDTKAVGTWHYPERE